SSALRPMLSEARCVAILRRLRVGVPLTVRTMSPATMPALAAGPPSTMDITITPLDWPAWPCSASGTATGGRATPSQPRPMCRRLNRARQPENRDVGARIAAGELRVHRRPAGHDQLELVAFRQRLLGGDHHVRLPERAGQMPRFGKPDGGDCASRRCRVGG